MIGPVLWGAARKPPANRLWLLITIAIISIMEKHHLHFPRIIEQNGGVGKEDRVYTYADYLTWPDDEQWELIDGVAYNMSPAPDRRHQDIVGEIFVSLYTVLTGSPCKVSIAPFDVRLSDSPQQEDDEITNVVQPDVSVFCDESDLDEKRFSLS